MTSAQAEVRQLSGRAAAHVLQTQGTDAGRRSGWLMISTILIESWDLYSASFILVFLKARYNPGWLLLGLTSAAVQAGAVVSGRFPRCAPDQRPAACLSLIFNLSASVSRRG